MFLPKYYPIPSFVICICIPKLSATVHKYTYYRYSIWGRALRASFKLSDLSVVDCNISLYSNMNMHTGVSCIINYKMNFPSTPTLGERKPLTGKELHLHIWCGCTSDVMKFFYPTNFQIFTCNDHNLNFKTDQRSKIMTNKFRIFIIHMYNLMCGQ